MHLLTSHYPRLYFHPRIYFYLSVPLQGDRNYLCCRGTYDFVDFTPLCHPYNRCPLTQVIRQYNIKVVVSKPCANVYV
jgi:hypothetical protein